VPSIATASAVTGGLTLGLAKRVGTTFAIRPFVRGQIAHMDTAGNKVDGTGFGAGITLGSSLP